MGASASSPNPTPVSNTLEEESSDEGSEIDNQLDLLKSGDQSDVTLICADKRFTVHTHIIGARSDVFRAMFYDLNKDRTLSIDNVSPHTFEVILHYMYSGKVPKLSVETALKVYEAADMYSMESLVSVCKRIIKKKMREGNAPLVLVFASKHEASDLKYIAVTYLTGRKSFLMGESWRRFCDNYPKLAIEVFIAFVRKAA